jgi:hypothetical protein
LFNPWLALSFKAAALGVEAQSVIALRLLRFAAGGPGMQAEASRMVMEKVAAFGEAHAVAGAAIMAGRKDHIVAAKALGAVRKRVRANRRRLSRRRRIAR